MLKITINTKKAHFETVAEAIRQLQIETAKFNRHTLLVWHDTLKDENYFKDLKPWQVINRIPGIDVLTRKVPCCILIEKMKSVFPSLYNFMPETLLLPQDNDLFEDSVANSKKTFIVKPDGGSLGAGISVVRPGEKFLPPTNDLYVAQEYIESFLLDNTKFDLRVYALIASVEPLKLYVYKDGLARFAIDKYDKGTLLSQLTNVSLNRDRDDVDYSKISQLISDVFPRMKSMGIDTDKLWKDIEDVITLTVIASHNHLKTSVNSNCPPIGYARCFQIIGFDILIDKNLKPWVIEANCRPSLKFHRSRERRMKVAMIKDAIRIATPMDSVQAALDSRRMSWSRREWAAFIGSGSGVISDIEARRKAALATSGFKCVYPSKNPEFKRVLSVADSVRTVDVPGFTVRSHVHGSEA